MFEMIEVKEDTRKETVDVLGWNVSLSERVWERCVEVPEGVEGQTQEGRLNDLLAFIRFNLKRVAAPRQEGFSAAYAFCVNVVNDNRRRSDYPDGLECPGEEVPLEVFASFTREGTPHLVVLTQAESSVLSLQES